MYDGRNIFTKKKYITMKSYSCVAFLFLICGVMFLESCTSSGSSTTNTPLKNTRWVLRALDDLKVFTPEGGKEAYILLQENEAKANGLGGCNNFFTTYTLSGKQLKFGLIASTEMFCEGRMDLERKFFKALESIVRYRVSGNYLYLYDSVRLIAKFEAVIG